MSQMFRFVVAAFFCAVSASPASAALMTFDLTTTGGTFAGTGSVSVNDTSGSGVDDPDFVAFSFTVTSQINAQAPLPFTFIKSMVSGIDWSVTGGLLSFDLDINTQNLQGGFLSFDLAFDTLVPISNDVACGSHPSSAFPELGASSALFCTLLFFHASTDHPTFSSATLVATPAAMPEPAPAALLVFGVAALGFARPPKKSVLRISKSELLNNRARCAACESASDDLVTSPNPFTPPSIQYATRACRRLRSPPSTRPRNPPRFCRRPRRPPSICDRALRGLRAPPRFAG